jgi:hypothetical protein
MIRILIIIYRANTQTVKVCLYWIMWHMLVMVMEIDIFTISVVMICRVIRNCLKFCFHLNLLAIRFVSYYSSPERMAASKLISTLNSFGPPLPFVATPPNSSVPAPHEKLLTTAGPLYPYNHNIHNMEIAVEIACAVMQSMLVAGASLADSWLHMLPKAHAQVPSFCAYIGRACELRIRVQIGALWPSLKKNT